MVSEPSSLRPASMESAMADIEPIYVDVGRSFKEVRKRIGTVSDLQSFIIHHFNLPHIQLIECSNGAVAIAKLFDGVPDDVQNQDHEAFDEINKLLCWISGSIELPECSKAVTPHMFDEMTQSTKSSEVGNIDEQLKNGGEQTMESEVVNNDMMSDDENLKIDEELVHEEAKFELLLVKEPSESVVARHMFDEMPDSQNCHKHQQLVELSVCIDVLNQDGFKEVCFDPGGVEMLQESSEPQADLKISEVHDSPSDKSSLVVQEKLTDLFRVLDELPRQEDYIGVLCIDPGGEKSIFIFDDSFRLKLVSMECVVSTVTCVLTGVHDFCCHFGSLTDVGNYVLASGMFFVDIKATWENVAAETGGLKAADLFGSTKYMMNFNNCLPKQELSATDFRGSHTSELVFDPGGGASEPRIDFHRPRYGNFSDYLVHQLGKVVAKVDTKVICFDPGGVDRWVKYISRGIRQCKIEELVSLWGIKFDLGGNCLASFDSWEYFLKPDILWISISICCHSVFIKFVIATETYEHGAAVNKHRDVVILDPRGEKVVFGNINLSSELNIMIACIKMFIFYSGGQVLQKLIELFIGFMLGDLWRMKTELLRKIIRGVLKAMKASFIARGVPSNFKGIWNCYEEVAAAIELLRDLERNHQFMIVQASFAKNVWAAVLLEANLVDFARGKARDTNGKDTGVETDLKQRVMIFSLSTVVYGQPNVVPYIETYPLLAASSYGHLKLFFEEICQPSTKARYEITSFIGGVMDNISLGEKLLHEWPVDKLESSAIGYISQHLAIRLKGEGQILNLESFEELNSDFLTEYYAPFIKISYAVSRYAWALCITVFAADLFDLKRESSRILIFDPGGECSRSAGAYFRWAIVACCQLLLCYPSCYMLVPRALLMILEDKDPLKKEVLMQEYKLIFPFYVSLPFIS